MKINDIVNEGFWSGFAKGVGQNQVASQLDAQEKMKDTGPEEEPALTSAEQAARFKTGITGYAKKPGGSNGGAGGTPGGNAPVGSGGGGDFTNPKAFSPSKMTASGMAATPERPSYTPPSSGYAQPGYAQPAKPARALSKPGSVGRITGTSYNNLTSQQNTNPTPAPSTTAKQAPAAQQQKTGEYDGVSSALQALGHSSDNAARLIASLPGGLAEPVATKMAIQAGAKAPAAQAPAAPPPQTAKAPAAAPVTPPSATPKAPAQTTAPKAPLATNKAAKTRLAKMSQMPAGAVPRGNYAQPSNPMGKNVTLRQSKENKGKMVAEELTKLFGLLDNTIGKKKK